MAGPTGGVGGGVGDVGAAVAVGGGLRVLVDLDSLELLGNTGSCKHRGHEAGPGSGGGAAVVAPCAGAVRAAGTSGSSITKHRHGWD